MLFGREVSFKGLYAALRAKRAKTEPAKTEPTSPTGASSVAAAAAAGLVAALRPKVPGAVPPVKSEAKVSGPAPASAPAPAPAPSALAPASAAAPSSLVPKASGPGSASTASGPAVKGEAPAARKVKRQAQQEVKGASAASRGDPGSSARPAALPPAAADTPSEVGDDLDDPMSAQAVGVEPKDPQELLEILAAGNVSGERRQRALQLASDPGFCGINAVDQSGCSALHLAVKTPDEELLRAIARNPSFTSADRQTFAEAKPEGWTALHMACWSATTDVDGWRAKAIAVLLEVPL